MASEIPDEELEIKPEDLDFWLRLPITQEFRRRIVTQFDHQDALLAAAPGASVDRYLGRAEVLDFIVKPYRLFEE